MSVLPNTRFSIVITVIMFLAQFAQAHDEPVIEAVTSDGRLVKLLQDHTWDFVTHKDRGPENSAYLTITELEEMQDACAIQVKLENNLGFKIRSLVPRFSIYNDKNIVFDHKSLSFTSVKPGRSQYRKFQFNDIGCHEIVWMRVHGADHCTMGDMIDMFNAEEGQCLEFIYVAPSDLINVSKDPIL